MGFPHSASRARARRRCGDQLTINAVASAQTRKGESPAP